MSCLTEARGLKYISKSIIRRIYRSCLTEARGLKFNSPKTTLCRYTVVPHRGTWIEIRLYSQPVKLPQSRASQRHVDWNPRYLTKIHFIASRASQRHVDWNTIINETYAPQICRASQRHVDWNNKKTNEKYDKNVVPHRGTWIEISSGISPLESIRVVPHRGAWIEIHNYSKMRYWRKVVPHRGAWIEIHLELHSFHRCTRRASQRRVDWNEYMIARMKETESRASQRRVDWNS